MPVVFTLSAVCVLFLFLFPIVFATDPEFGHVLFPLV